MTRAEAVRKAAALLRLAARPGTAGEAAAAAARAQAIMDEWELSEAALDLEGGAADEEVRDFSTVPGGELDPATGGRYQRWRGALAVHVARANGCFVFRNHHRGGAMEIVGRPSGVETARYLFAWLAREVAHLTELNGRGLGAVWRREFAEGAVQAIGERLRAQRQETADRARAEAAGSAALVRVEAALVRLEARSVEAERYARAAHGLVNRGGSRSVRYDGGARAAGRAAGARVSLARPARQIGGRT